VPAVAPGGHTWRVLLQEILRVADEPLVLAPADRDAEYANTWWLGAEPHERLGVSVAEVVAAFEEVAGLVGARVRALGHRGTATFYVWHDQQAGQLRCSTSSLGPDDLPFDGEFRATGKLDGIVAEFLGDGEPGFVRFGGFGPDGDQEFEVWTFDVSVVPAEDEH